jgi:ABC-type glycerol-3-phosphate transport system permease component
METHLPLVTLGLSDMIVGDVFAWGPLMEGSIIASIPIIIMYLFSHQNIWSVEWL